METITEIMIGGTEVTVSSDLPSTGLSLSAGTPVEATSSLLAIVSGLITKEYCSKVKKK